ncbi:MAG: FMN-binding protein [Betaproteobacteria bacterium]|nr:FMN-binding protein [Betaproteobacteria bacterium]
MSQPTTPTLPAPQATPTTTMILTLGLVATLCGLIIVGAYEGSLSAVQENRRIVLERAISKVLPGAERIVGYQASSGGEIAVADGGDNSPPGTLRFHAAYDAGGALMGIAAEGAAKGYADTVRVMFGYSPKCQCIVGIGVVSMRETPGIGDKILTDQEFLANFKALDVRLNGELKALANEVKAVKHGSKTNPWQIDAISGATITSRAVGKGINDAAQALLPRLLPNLEKIGKNP